MSRSSQPIPSEPNDSVLANLRAESAPHVRGGLAIPGDEAYELHAHPDLEERLDEVVMGLPATPVAAYGYPAYAHANGVLFSFARGVYRLYFRLATLERPFHGEPAIGRDWMSVEAYRPQELESALLDEPPGKRSSSQEVILGRLRHWAREAHAYAATLQTGP